MCFIVADTIIERVPRLLVSMRVTTESQNIARSHLRDLLKEDIKWLGWWFIQGEQEHISIEVEK